MPQSTSPKLSQAKAAAIDLLAVVGIALIAAGAGMIYTPAGVIVLGIILLAGAVQLVRRG